MPSATNAKPQHQHQRSSGSRNDKAADGNRKSRNKNGSNRKSNDGGNGKTGSGSSRNRNSYPPSDVPELKPVKLCKDVVAQSKPRGFNVVPDDFPALTRSPETSREIVKYPLVRAIVPDIVETQQIRKESPPPEVLGTEIVPAHPAVEDENLSAAARPLIQDQFGLAALFTALRKAEEEPDLVTLSLGMDLSSLLNFDMKGSEKIHSVFGGPFSENLVRAENLPWDVPPYYRFSEIRCPVQSACIRRKLFPLKVEEMKDELLFFLFYTFTQDVLQQMAAMELYKRDWRYHVEEKVWLTPVPGSRCFQRSQFFERGLFFFFDPITWKKVSREFCVEYSKLESRPVLPSTPLMPHS